MKRSGSNENHEHSGRIWGIWCVLITIFIGQLLFYTWCRVQCVRIGYEISCEAQRYRDNLNAQNNLRIEIARLRSPERISNIAENQLGLVSPAPEQIIVMP